MQNHKTKIILASKSHHRKELLKKTGLLFSVMPSQVEEEVSAEKGAAYLVKTNAVLKARDIAKRVKSGIVLGCDTLVFSGNKEVIGKPRSVNEAKKNLKILMRKSHWLYSGIALIDAETNKTVVDFEKTKIYMDQLTNKEIDSYYKRVSFQDKAGGFDIEGRGAFFIERIEGCYFNVVGLPLFKLGKMLKQFGIHIFACLCFFYFSGCARTEYNLATHRQETYFISTDREIAIGESIARYVEQKFELSTDFDLNERIFQIAQRLAAVSDRRELVYTVRIINKDEVNAFALPGGFIYVFKGLIDAAESDDEIAGVIAHEMGHVTAKHAIKRMQAQYGYNLAMILAAASQSGHMAQGVNLAYASIITGHSRQDEFEADRLAVRYMERAGYDPYAVTSFLEKLYEVNAKKPMRDFSYWRTHPYVSQRIANVQKEITGEMTFRDYIRLTEEKRDYK